MSRKHESPSIHQKDNQIYSAFINNSPTHNVVLNFIFSKKYYEIPQNKCINYSREQSLKNTIFSIPTRSLEYL